MGFISPPALRTVHGAFTAICGLDDSEWKVEFAHGVIQCHVRALTSLPAREARPREGGGPRGAVVLETLPLPGRLFSSQRPSRLPVGKMVARRKKRAARGCEAGFPSPPGYSGGGQQDGGPGHGQVSRGAAVPSGPQERPRGWTGARGP